MNLLQSLLLIVVSFHSALAETHMSSDSLGVSYEFKLHVDAGREDCFFQYVAENASVYVSFQVIRGGDGHAAFLVANPLGEVVLPYEWKTSADYEEREAKVTGHYQLCIDNSLSHFAEKLVSVYFNSFRKDTWNEYVEEIEKHGVTVKKFTDTFRNVESHLNDMGKSQEHSRNAMVVDWYLLKGNNSWVLYWSLLQCFVIMVATGTQVYFIRSFFADPRDRKPRI